MCPSCGHQEMNNCRCDNCTELRRQNQKRIEDIKLDIIQSNYNDTVSRELPHIEALTLRDAVFLLSIFSHSVTEDLRFAYPFDERTPEFAPTFELKNACVKHLYAKGLISISCESSTDSFVYDDELTNIDAYYPTRVLWNFLPNVDRSEVKHFLRQLNTKAEKKELWSEDWYEDVLDVWRTIGKYECIEYYLHLLNQRNFEPEEIGPKTHSVFEDLLTKFSVGQVYNLTWQAVRDTTDYVVRENLPKYRAKNMFIGAVQRKADKFLAQGWQVNNSRRDFDCPQSVLSSTFFNLFLGIGADGFEKLATENFTRQSSEN